MEQKPTIHIAITDDHPMVISGLEHMLRSAGHIQIVATYTSGKELLGGLQDITPDVLLLDVMLGDTTAEQLIPGVLALQPQIRILVISSVDNIQIIRQLIKLGASGYVLKTVPPLQLIEALESVYKGVTYISAELKELLLQHMLSNRKHAPSRGTLLTRRESDVLKEIAKGCSGKEIADNLHISLHTVETHKRNLFIKLDVKNAVSLIARATSMDLL